MIKIYKAGKRPLKVTTSAFNNFYKHSGWSTEKPQTGKRSQKVVEESVESEVEEQALTDEDATNSDWDDTDWDEADQPTKPLSEMNRAELEQLAEEKGVSLAGLTNVKQMREVLKAVM